MVNGLNFRHLRDNGDATANYAVDFAKGLTLRKLVENVLRDAPDDWGYFEIAPDRAGTPARFCDTERVIEYRCGKIIYIKTELYEKYADKVIEKLDASGGWTRMDYKAHITADDTDADKESEQKAAFVEKYLQPLLQAANVNVASAKYHKNKTTGEETVVVAYKARIIANPDLQPVKIICVTADSFIAMTTDVINNL